MKALISDLTNGGWDCEGIKKIVNHDGSIYEVFLMPKNWSGPILNIKCMVQPGSIRWFMEQNELEYPYPAEIYSEGKIIGQEPSDQRGL